MNKSLGVLFLVVIVIGVVAWAAFNNPDKVTASVYVTSPSLESPISSPLAIEGKAKGTWFFEGSFPVYLVNWDGLIIGQGIAQAQGEWMTEDYVPFKVTITFDAPSYGDNGTLIFKKDNPSGLPENDAAIELPVKFK